MLNQILPQKGDLDVVNGVYPTTLRVDVFEGQVEAHVWDNDQAAPHVVFCGFSAQDRSDKPRCQTTWYLSGKRIRLVNNGQIAARVAYGVAAVGRPL